MTVDHIVRAILHAVSVAGVDHVALGSDFDGNVMTPIDASHMAALTHALLVVGVGDGAWGGWLAAMH